MKLTVFGAARTVTGSMTLIEYGGKKNFCWNVALFRAGAKSPTSRI